MGNEKANAWRELRTEIVDLQSRAGEFEMTFSQRVGGGPRNWSLINYRRRDEFQALACRATLLDGTPFDDPVDAVVAWLDEVTRAKQHCLEPICDPSSGDAPIIFQTKGGELLGFVLPRVLEASADVCALKESIELSVASRPRPRKVAPPPALLFNLVDFLPDESRNIVIVAQEAAFHRLVNARASIDSDDEPAGEQARLRYQEAELACIVESLAVEQEQYIILGADPSDVEAAMPRLSAAMFHQHNLQDIGLWFRLVLQLSTRRKALYCANGFASVLLNTQILSLDEVNQAQVSSDEALIRIKAMLVEVAMKRRESAGIIRQEVSSAASNPNGTSGATNQQRALAIIRYLRANGYDQSWIGEQLGTSERTVRRWEDTGRINRDYAQRVIEKLGSVR